MLAVQDARDRRPAFNASIHGARGLFAMLVFCFHVANSGLPTFYDSGHWLTVWVFLSLKFGVELFFGISGYVILGALARAPSMRAFIWDRATRIYPLLWTTLIFITVVALSAGRWLPGLGDWLLNFLAPPPFFPLPMVNAAAWSLGYEVCFYILCAACWYARSRGRRWLPAAIVSGSTLLIFLPRAILMPAGLLVATDRHHGSQFRRLALAASGLWLIPFLLLWRWLELHAPMQDIARLNPGDMGLAQWVLFVPAIALAGLCGTLGLEGIARQVGWLPRLLRTPLFNWLGTISYSFYLWHPVVMAMAKSALYSSGLVAHLGMGSQLAFALLALPPALVVADISQRLIEVRLTRRLRRYGPREDVGQAPMTATATSIRNVAEVFPSASAFDRSGS